jgi:hypothetical protein
LLRAFLVAEGGSSLDSLLSRFLVIFFMVDLDG